MVISIHAPRVGSDNPFSGDSISVYGFLSTLPAWGATAKTDKNNNIFCAV